MSSNIKTVGIIGAGKVGTAVGVLLEQAGYQIGLIADPDIARLRKTRRLPDGVITQDDPVPRSLDMDILFITTPDRLIGEVAHDIAIRGGIRKGQIVVHMSGSLTSDVLAPVRDFGAYAASLHPLQSFADYEQAIKNIPGSVFCLEGDEPALPVLRGMIVVFKGKEITIPREAKVLYHAAAVMASNYLVTLLWCAVMLLEEIGMEKKDAVDALLPLVNGTLKNVTSLGVPEALTGPIARGDATTVGDHIDAIEKKRPDLLEFYRVVGALTVRAARHNGNVPEEFLEKIEEILKKTN